MSRSWLAANSRPRPTIPPGQWVVGSIGWDNFAENPYFQQVHIDVNPILPVVSVKSKRRDRHGPWTPCELIRLDGNKFTAGIPPANGSKLLFTFQLLPDLSAQLEICNAYATNPAWERCTAAYDRIKAVPAGTWVSPRSRITVTGSPAARAAAHTWASSSGPGAVTVSWQASTDDVGVDGYSVYRGTTSGFSVSTSSKVGQVSSSLTEFTNTNVPTGAYFYKVVAGDRTATGKITRVD